MHVPGCLPGHPQKWPSAHHPAPNAAVDTLRYLLTLRGTRAVTAQDGLPQNRPSLSGVSPLRREIYACDFISLPKDKSSNLAHEYMCEYPGVSSRDRLTRP